MNERERKKEKLKEISKESRERTDKFLSKELQALKEASLIDLENLRPQVSDSEIYNQLIAAVAEANCQNEDLAQLKSRLENLGSTVISMGKEVARLLIA